MAWTLFCSSMPENFNDFLELWWWWRYKSGFKWKEKCSPCWAACLKFSSQQQPKWSWWPWFIPSGHGFNRFGILVQARMAFLLIYVATTHKLSFSYLINFKLMSALFSSVAFSSLQALLSLHTEYTFLWGVYSPAVWVFF